MTSGRGQQAECSGEGHSSSAIIHAELAIDVLGMQFDHAGRHHQLSR